MKTGHRLAPHLYSLSKLIWRLAHPFFTVPPQASSPSLVLEQTDIKTGPPSFYCSATGFLPIFSPWANWYEDWPPSFYCSTTGFLPIFSPWANWYKDWPTHFLLFRHPCLFLSSLAVVTDGPANRYSPPPLALCRLVLSDVGGMPVKLYSAPFPPPHGVIHKTSLLTSPLSTHPWPFWIPS